MPGFVKPDTQAGINCEEKGGCAQLGSNIHALNPDAHKGCNTIVQEDIKPGVYKGLNIGFAHILWAADT